MEKLKVLVVEDEATMRDLLHDMLLDAGVTWVDTCENGQQAEERYAPGCYHIVMLDLGLPDLDGHDLMRRIKRQDEQQHIVLVTADDSIESIQRAISAGANGYVVKPYSREKILDVVNNYLTVHGDQITMPDGLHRRH
ncbi:two-component system chemotaxis response regulator CheY [Tamilnaduibacter salinus]|uniref:Two-component system chemotaxis response regulator CheY n=1 Tax=Tamilnaduibacter salinus TaxID=1484056 RepID=A0A2U1CY35_9GAMM|nr:response regulator [Tamilnaduibacter salinus]PVY77404.1 two-component system chemotaxis response regulator CheY [Tamilnaduibacter salinus]